MPTHQSLPLPTNQPDVVTDTWVGVQFWLRTLGISRHTLDRWIARGLLPRPVLFGTARRWRLTTCELFLAERERAVIGLGQKPQEVAAHA
jgi:predicted DNA-binding transcriptional regulator AlpA